MREFVYTTGTNEKITVVAKTEDEARIILVDMLIDMGILKDCLLIIGG